MLSASSSRLFLSCLLAVGLLTPASECARAFFVFGDSLVDSGNNNYRMTTARADAPPYGIDYPTHRPTGRFSNGLNIPDIISEHLGAETALPYLSPQLHGNKLLVGANFASAGVGILNDTGFQFLDIVRMNRQLEYFNEYQGKLRALVGAVRARQVVRRALVLITLGGNDFVNNYYLVPYSLRSQQYKLPDFVRYLISEYNKILVKLHTMGCRRVLVTGTGPLGCVPAILAQRSRNGECVAELMRASELFNPQLSAAVDMLKPAASAPAPSSPPTPTASTSTSSPTREPTGSRRPRTRAAARAPTTGWGCARRRPTCAATGASTCSGTPTTPRSAPTGSSSASSWPARSTMSAP